MRFLDFQSLSTLVGCIEQLLSLMAVAQANPVSSQCLFYLRSQIGRFNKLFLWSPVVDTDGSYLCKLPGSKANVVLQHSPNAESKTVRSERKKPHTIHKWTWKPDVFTCHRKTTPPQYVRSWTQIMGHTVCTIVYPSSCVRSHKIIRHKMEDNKLLNWIRPRVVFRQIYWNIYLKFPLGNCQKQSTYSNLIGNKNTTLALITVHNIWIVKNFPLVD